MSAGMLCNPASSRSASARSAPRAASSIASARPMPLAAPVMATAAPGIAVIEGYSGVEIRLQHRERIGKGGSSENRKRKAKSGIKKAGKEPAVFENLFGCPGGAKLHPGEQNYFFLAFL